MMRRQHHHGERRQSQEEQQDQQTPTKWIVGQKVEACDTLGDWYPAKVLEINGDQVLIHFQKWSSRYDQWFNMDSELIRELNIVKNATTRPELKVDDSVLGRWTDNKIYPGRIVKIFPDNVSCIVWFYDGYRKKLKLDTLQKLPENYQGEKFPSLPTTVVVDQPESFVCENCKKVFRRKSLLEQHLKHFHNITPPAPAENEIVQNSADESLTKDSIKDGESVAASVDSSIVQPSLESEDTKETQQMKRDILNLFRQKLQLAMEAEKSANQTNLELGHGSGLAAGSGSAHIETISRASSKIDETSKTAVPQNKRRRLDNRRSRKINFRVQKGKLTTASRPYLMKNGKPNNVLPFNDPVEVVQKNENLLLEEIVKCSCGYEYESGLMVQCEHCLYWQHGSCVYFNHENDVPDGYLCPFCKNATCGKGEQLRNISNINLWLKEGIYPKVSRPQSIEKQPEAAQEIINDSDEKAARDRVRRVNFLSSVALDIKESIAALNLSIQKKSLTEDQIAERQRALNEQLDLVCTQLDELESDDEFGSFEGRLSRTSSCSTLSADLPDFFGNSSEFEFDENPSTSLNTSNQMETV